MNAQSCITTCMHAQQIADAQDLLDEKMHADFLPRVEEEPCLSSGNGYL